MKSNEYEVQSEYHGFYVEYTLDSARREMPFTFTLAYTILFFVSNLLFLIFVCTRSVRFSI